MAGTTSAALAPVRRLCLVCAGSFAALLAGCASAGVDHALVGATLDNSSVRRSFYEATLRTLDAHPEYVDEFFRAARGHPRTLGRFTADYTRELHAPDLAPGTARDLAQNPESLRVILVDTIDASGNRPHARAAIARAIEERSEAATDIIADRPSAVEATLHGTVGAVQSRPAARRSFLAGMRAESERIAPMILGDPNTRKAMTTAMAHATEASVARRVEPGRHESVPADRGKERPHPSRRR